MLSVFAFFAVFMKIFDRQNMLIFFKIFNHRWRWLAWFHRFFGAQTNFFVNFIYKNPRKHLQNPWHSYHNFWHGFWTFQAICLLSKNAASVKKFQSWSKILGNCDLFFEDCHFQLWVLVFVKDFSIFPIFNSFLRINIQKYCLFFNL